MSEPKLTPAQSRLLRDVERHHTPRKDGWVLRDMRRNKSGIELERLGLVERDYPEPGPWRGTVRITMRITAAGRQALAALSPPSDGGGA